MSTTDFSQTLIFLDHAHVFTLSYMDEKSPGCEKVYVAMLKKTDGPGIQWVSERIESPKLIQKIKSGFKREHGLDVTLDLQKNDTLELKIKHPLLEINDSIVLKQQQIDKTTLIEQRINYVENLMTEQVYPVTRDMLGPGILIHPDANFPIPWCIEYYDAMAKGTSIEMKPLTESNPSFNFCPSLVPQCIKRFYDIKHRFTKETITPAKNQFVVNGFVRKDNGGIPVKNINMYTVFTRRFDDNVIGLIIRTRTSFQILMAGYQVPSFKIINRTIVQPDGKTETKTCCTEKDFMDHRYICILPFHLETGGYMNGNTGRWHLVQNQKLYPYIDRMVDDNISVDTNDRYSNILISL